MSAPRFDVPDTDKLVTPVIAPSISAAPVMVRLLLPPARVDPVLIVVPVKMRSPPDRVIALVYVCVPDVVTSAPRFDVPEIDRFVTPVIAPSTSAAPVMVRLLLPPATV